MHYVWTVITVRNDVYTILPIHCEAKDENLQLLVLLLCVGEGAYGDVALVTVARVRRRRSRTRYPALEKTLELK